MIIYRELSSLEKDLGIPVKTLYAVSNSLNRHYRSVRLPKKSGGYRNLSVPDAVLKKIQRRIADTLLVHMPVAGCAMAYCYGGSALRNAKQHIGKPMVLKLDILHFFDSIRYSTVKETVFPPEIYSEQIRILLAMLCYHRDALPQGAPSSPVITNIILRDFDERVTAWCRGRMIGYSRYCDDMTFSGEFDAKEVTCFIRRELMVMGFLLNEQKTRLQYARDRQCVTGIVVNERANVPSEYRRKLRQELYYCRKYGVAEHLRRQETGCPEVQYMLRLLGKVNYVLHVNPDSRDFMQQREWLLQQLRK